MQHLTIDRKIGTPTNRRDTKNIATSTHEQVVEYLVHVLYLYVVWKYRQHGSCSVTITKLYFSKLVLVKLEFPRTVLLSPL